MQRLGTEHTKQDIVESQGLPSSPCYGTLTRLNEIEISATGLKTLQLIAKAESNGEEGRSRGRRLRGLDKDSVCKRRKKNI